MRWNLRKNRDVIERQNVIDNVNAYAMFDFSGDQSLKLEV